MDTETKTETHVVYGRVGEVSMSTVLCRRGDGEWQTVVGWQYIDGDGSTENLGHWSGQGNRERWIKKLPNGSIAMLVFGSGYWPSGEGSGYDWGWDATLSEYTGGLPLVDEAVGLIEKI